MGIATAGIAALLWFRRSGPPTMVVRTGERGDPDLATLTALQRAGSNIALTTEVNFYLYLPSQRHARSVAGVATRRGYIATVRRPFDGTSRWLCRLSREMAPQPEAIGLAREELESLAERYDGEFDGWEAAVTY